MGDLAEEVARQVATMRAAHGEGGVQALSVFLVEFAARTVSAYAEDAERHEDDVIDAVVQRLAVCLPGPAR